VLPPGSNGYGLPSGSTHFPGRKGRISPYETRSSGYRSQSNVRGLAPSLQNLTGKRSLTYSVAPFMVELFTAGRLTRSPERSHPGVVCRQTAAPHASRVERTRNSKSGPHGQDLHLLCLPSSGREEAAERPLHRRGLAEGKVCPHRPSSHLLLSHNTLTSPAAQTAHRHWIERWYYSALVASSIRGKRATGGITPTSLH